MPETLQFAPCRSFYAIYHSHHTMGHTLDDNTSYCLRPYLLRLNFSRPPGVETSTEGLQLASSWPWLLPDLAALAALTSAGHAHVTSSLAKKAARQPCKACKCTEPS